MSCPPTILNSKYFYFFTLLLVYFILTPVLADDQFSNAVLFIIFSLLLLFSMYVIPNNRLLMCATIFLAVISYSSYYYVIWINRDANAYIIHFIFTLSFLSLITLATIYSVAIEKEINSDALLGAICGYLLIGLTWTYLYLTIVSIDPSSFSIHLNNDGARARIDHFIYYSFVTLTTTGYGDILALKSIPRNFSWLEAVVGQVYLAVWISQLVGLRLLQKQKSLT